MLTIETKELKRKVEMIYKFACVKPTITGKEFKIDKETYDTLQDFMNTSKRVIKDMPSNQALFKELEDYTQNYREMEIQKHNVEVEVRKLELKKSSLINYFT